MIAVLTFDDGYIEHYAVAKELYKADIQATFFITAGLKNYGGRRLLTTEPKLIREIADIGHEVGSHTYAHKDLTRLSPEEVDKECRLSKTALEDITGADVVSLAYPYGSFSNAVVNIVSKYYKFARTMGGYNRWNDRFDLYAIGSVGARHLPKLLFKAITSKPKLLVVTFHLDLHLVKSVIWYLKLFNAKYMTLKDTFNILMQTHV